MHNLSCDLVDFHNPRRSELHPVPTPFTVTANLRLAMVGVSGHLLIAAPSLYLMLCGLKDAGEETMSPKREDTMYEGIYKRIRHPQAVGEFPLWWVLAFLEHSPFLVFFSFAYVPVWYYQCVAEERDLLIRYGATYEEYRAKTGFWLPKGRNKNNTT